MTDDRTQPEALRLADWIESDMTCDGDIQIAAELRRLHAENERLREAAQAALATIEGVREYVAVELANRKSLYEHYPKLQYKYAAEVNDLALCDNAIATLHAALVRNE